MGKRKSTRRGKKPKTDARQVVRRPTAVHRPATGEQRRVAAPGGKSAKRSSMDMGLGAKYAAVVAAAIIVVTAGAAFSVTDSMRKEAENAIIDNCLETAKAVLAVTSLDNRPIAESSRVLVTAVARAIAPGRRLPFRSEPVTGTIRFNVRQDLILFPLEGDGTRGKPVPTVYEDGAHIAVLDGSAGTHWFMFAPAE